MKQSKNLINSEPENYSVDKVNEIIDNMAVETMQPEISENITEEESIKPNIIVIMNESFSDLRVISDFETSEEFLPFFYSLKENTIRGNLHMSVFGASTPNSEWEMLTGNSMAFLPARSVPYQQYIFRKASSLVRVLDSQGYTTSAFHSYYPEGYRRSIVYPFLGFDTFLGINDLKNLENLRKYPSDISTYSNIISLFENKKDDEKIFNFTLTMQNHSGYEEKFDATITLEEGEKTYPKLEQYLTIIRESDKALEYLINYFENYDEPTIILMFGDHQPYVEDEFYEYLMNKCTEEDVLAKYEKKYITPFILWANYDIEEKYIEDMSANYLSTLLLETAGLKMSKYQTYLKELYKTLPVITGNGYMDNTNTYHTFDEENEYTELIDEYRILQYNNMFDNSNKVNSIFELEAQK